MRKLGGYQKHHHLPDGHTEAAQNFVRKVGQAEVKEAADSLFANIRSLFGYKRRDFDYTCEDGFAWIKTPDFDLQIRVDQCPQNPKNYLLTTEIVALHAETIATDPRFHNCFTQHCDLHIQVDESAITFSLLTLRDLGKLLDHSQKAFDILAKAEFGLRLR